jgi:acyl-CoA synthetase (AMP-forming)/AMP-acid ligase II
VAKEILISIFPLNGCHYSRLVLGNLASWVHASTIVYASESYNARAILDTLEAEKCTGVHGVPTHFLGLLDEIDGEARQEGGKTWNLSSVRWTSMFFALNYVSGSRYIGLALASPREPPSPWTLCVS